MYLKLVRAGEVFETIGRFENKPDFDIITCYVALLKRDKFWTKISDK